MHKGLLPLWVLLAMGAVEASAAMYKYTDEKGRVVYSQSPPPSGEAKVIKPPPPPATSVESPEQKASPAEPEAQAADDPQEEARRKAESDQIKRENCARARKMLQTYNNPQNRLLKKADGTYERVTDERRQQGIDSANRSIQEFCN